MNEGDARVGANGSHHQRLVQKTAWCHTGGAQARQIPPLVVVDTHEAPTWRRRRVKDVRTSGWQFSTTLPASHSADLTALKNPAGANQIGTTVAVYQGGRRLHREARWVATLQPRSGVSPPKRIPYTKLRTVQTQQGASGGRSHTISSCSTTTNTTTANTSVRHDGERCVRRDSTSPQRPPYLGYSSHSPLPPSLSPS
jgi:hypothetical protein